MPSAKPTYAKTSQVVVFIVLLPIGVPDSALIIQRQRHYERALRPIQTVNVGWCPIVYMHSNGRPAMAFVLAAICTISAKL